jgi:prophage regulatory protein
VNATVSLQNDYSSIKILRLPQVCEMTGFGRSMIYRMEAELRFPKRVKIGTRAVGWLESEVQAWLVNKIAASRAQGKSRPPEITQ